MSSQPKKNNSGHQKQQSETKRVLKKETDLDARKKRDRDHSKDSTQIDLNIATADQLAKLPGISKDLADRIINYRNKYGSFENFENLRSVHGIGSQKLVTLNEHCYIKSVKEEKQSEVDLKTEKENETFTIPLHTQQLIVKNYICKYVSKDDFKETDVKPGMLMFLHVNIVSLRRNFKKLQSLVTSCKHSPDIICVSEAKNPKVEKDVALTSYTFRQKNSELQSGGVGLYSRHPCKERDDLCFVTKHCENVWVEFKRKRDSETIVVGAVYRHPYMDHLKEFVENLKSVITKIKKESKLFYILGDINLNMLNVETKIQDYCDTLIKLGCKLLITKPTRVTKTRSANTLIDHIYTNDEVTSNSYSGIIETYDVSDHYPVYCVA